MTKAAGDASAEELNEIRTEVIKQIELHVRIRALLLPHTFLLPLVAPWGVPSCGAAGALWASVTGRN